MVFFALAFAFLAEGVRGGRGEDGPKGSNPAADEASRSAVEKAVKLLEAADAEFRAVEFDAVATPSADGRFHRVEFTRKAGSGKERHSVSIPVPPRATSASRDPALRPGSLAPRTAAADADGEPIDLKDLRGKAVVLLFCVPNCPPCKNFYDQAGDAYKDFKDRPFAILEVMGGPTVEAARRAARAAALPWPVVCEGEPDEGSIQARWKVEAFPTFWLIDADGRIAAEPSLAPPAASAVEVQVRRAEAKRPIEGGRASPEKP